MEAEGSFGDLPTDAFEQILLRVPPSRRRRLRLVCRHWRNVIDERTPVRLGGAKTLAFVNHRPAGSAAYVLDDLVEGCVRELWSSASNPNSLYSHMRMVGTCNGLLCLYDESAGDIALLNPVTGETLDVPGPPSHRLRPQGAFCSAYYERFSFAYHVATERYKIVHLAVNGQTRAMDVVQVLTLGVDASWRNVPAPAGSSCCPLFGVVSDDQATYWISDDANMLMSFDLTNERVAPVRSLPAGSKFGIGCLRKVYGRPCVAARTYDFLKGTETEEMWLLERGGWLGRERWRRRFYVTGQVSIIPPPVQRVMGPHFVQGEHILTCCLGSLYAHRFVSSVAWPQCRVVQIDEHWQHHEPMFTCGHHSVVRTFSYVETTEPLRFDNDKKKAAGKTTFLGQMLTSIFNGLSIMTATID